MVVRDGMKHITSDNFGAYLHTHRINVVAPDTHVDAAARGWIPMSFFVPIGCEGEESPEHNGSMMEV